MWCVATAVVTAVFCYVCVEFCRYGSDEMVDRWMHWVNDDWDSLQPGNYEEHATAATNGNGSSSSQRKDTVTVTASAGQAPSSGSA
jgi:hypothetical protein